MISNLRTRGREVTVLLPMAHDHSKDGHTHPSPIKPYDLVSKELDGSKIEVRAAITWEDLSLYRAKALKKLQANVTLPGFRKGHVPEQILLERFGEMTLLNDMAEMALEDAYPIILERELLRPINFPSINITKMAPGNPLEFKMEIEVYPTISISDYKRIAKKHMLLKEEVSLEEREVEDALRELSVRLSPSLQNEEKTLLDDEVAKKLGAEDVDDLKKKMREQMMEEKVRQAKEKKRMAILEEIVKESGMPIPDRFIEEELDNMLAQFKEDLLRMGQNFNDYLSKIKKSVEEVRKEWMKDAEQRVKFHLALLKIGEEEKLTPSAEEIENEATRLRELYKDAPEKNIRPFAERLLRNEKVFQFLEGQK